MFLRIKSYFQTIGELDIGNQFFLYGIFFLPSTSLIAFSFLLLALIFSIKSSKNIFLKDGWNYPLILSIGLIIFSTLNITFLNNPYSYEKFDMQIILFNLIKWIILLVCFIGFQDFLNSNKQRTLFAKFLISGTIPLILSCFLQKFYWDQGPYQIFNGLIIWFMKPINQTGGVSGLFSNVNYTGIWLGLTLPFCIALSRTEKKLLNKFILFILISLFSYFIFETFSRNAFLSLMISFLFLIKFKYSIILLLSQISFFIFAKIVNLNDLNLLGFNFNLPIIETISNITSLSINPEDSRVVIYKNAFSLIKERPFFGWGASTFNFNFTRNNLDILNLKPFHTHNMPLELAYNFGIPLAIILITTSIILLLIGIKKLSKFTFNKEEFLISKAWIISILIIIVTHLSDVTFYEDRIGILITTFFSGLRCFVKDNKLSYEN